ncbi:hypothetical protein BH10BAC2_BH10BAC2_20820 [soil metagenome]
MFRLFYPLVCLVLTVLTSSCHPSNEYVSAQQKLSSIYPLKQPAQEGDWLYTRTDMYQSLDDYIQSKPTSTDSIRKKIYIMLIGDFDSAQMAIVTGTADYLHAFYGLSVDYIGVVKGAGIFGKSRKNPIQGQLQLSAREIMDSVLKPQLPEDAAT